MKLQRTGIVSLMLCAALFGVGCNTSDTAPTGSGAPPTASGTTVSDARGCAHPYFPLRAGYSAKYSTVGNAGAASADDAYTLEVTDVGDHQATLAMTFENSQLRSTQVVRCDDAGGIAEGSYASVFPDPASGNGFSAETLSAEGVLLPANVRVGDTWTQKFTIVMHPQGELAQAFRDIRATVTISHQAAGEETVVTPAGAYQALRVESSTNMQFQGAMANLPIPEGDTSAILSKTWYARGVGIVKQQTDEANAVSMLEEVHGNR